MRVEKRGDCRTEKVAAPDNPSGEAARLESENRSFQRRSTVKSATAHLRNEKIFLQPDSKTIKGFWISCEPVLVTSENDTALGGKILWILARSTQGVPDPEMSGGRVESRDGVRALLNAAGISSYETFADFTKCVAIVLDENGVEFTPTKNGGPRKRFLFLKKKMIRCRPVEAEVADGLKLAFEGCE
jgi:hypothetical protein